MENSASGILQFLPPLFVGALLVFACYHFYNKYVVVSRELAVNLQKLARTVRSMTEGDEQARRNGVGKVFMNTPLENTWKDFAKTLHAQTTVQEGLLKQTRSRMTVPAEHFFSVSAVIDRPLGVDYFKHLPGILTGIGIIGTFSGLLFGLSNFDTTSAEAMQTSISLLIAGVRDAFYASAAAITAAMVITHWEKLLYYRCLSALDELVDAVNSSFEAGVGEEYLASLVRHSTATNDQARVMKDEFIQAMVPVIKQLEHVQTQQASNMGEVLEQALTEANRRLANQLETALIRQIKNPIEELSKRLEARGGSAPAQPMGQELARKVIRARQNDSAETSQEAS